MKNHKRGSSRRNPISSMNEKWVYLRRKTDALTKTSRDRVRDAKKKRSDTSLRVSGFELPLRDPKRRPAIEGLTWPNLSSLEVAKTGKEGSGAGNSGGCFATTRTRTVPGIKSDLIILCFIPGESEWHPRAQRWIRRNGARKNFLKTAATVPQRRTALSFRDLFH